MPSPIVIKVSENGTNYNAFPYVFSTDMPYFSWELPGGISQHQYCLELKTRLPRLKTDGTYGYGYYNSGLITSASTVHKIYFSLDQNTWTGTIEIRLRILNSSGDVVYGTHSYSAEASYDFELSPQYYLWDSNEDLLYCVRDVNYSVFNNISEFQFVWENAKDEDLDFPRTMSYELQICTSPLFEDGLHTVTTFKQNENGSVTSSYNWDISDYGDVIFFRVRSYDGFDYGDWSIVRAFYPILNALPVCEIISINSSVYPRSEGEILVELIVHDENNFYANMFLEYSEGYVIPEPNSSSMERCVLSGTGAVIPTNKIIIVKWLSARTIIDRQVNLAYLYLSAFDGISTSNYDTYGPFSINNIGIGFGVGGGSIDNIGFYISGRFIDFERFYQIPEERIFNFGDEQEIDFDGTLLLKESFIGAPFMTNPAIGMVKRPVYAMYHGYDFLNDERLAQELILDYRNESKYRILRGYGYTDEQIRFGFYDHKLDYLFSSFTQIYLDNGDYGMFSYREGDTYGLEMGLGRENEEIYYRMARRPDIEPYISIHRPKVAGGYGIYVDGPGMNGNTDDYGRYSTNPLGSLWSNMYNVHPFHDHNVVTSEFYTNSDGIGMEQINTTYSPFGERLWRKFFVRIEIRFPFFITNTGEFPNDQFSFILNGTNVFEGSLLNVGESIKYFDFPYIKHEQYDYWSGETTYYNEVDEAKYETLLNMLDKMFYESGFFDNATVASFTPDYDKKTIVGYIYGRKSFRLKTFEVRKTHDSCYETLGIETLLQNQTYEDINIYNWGESSYRGKKDFVVRLNDWFTYYPDSKYLYELTPEQSYEYGEVKESPAVQSTEPLYTCSVDDVNEDGFHFKYSRRRYVETGKVFVRLYRAERCHPFEDATLGYRDFIVVPDATREGIFHREVTKKIRGVPPVQQLITLEDGTSELAYFDNEGTCISHSEGDEFYTRLPVRSWQQKIASKTILVADYVECDVAFTRQYIERGIAGESGFLNRHTQVNPSSYIHSGYNFYIMGAYKPSEEQIEAGSAITPSYDYASVVAVDQDGDFRRFNQNWLGYTQGECNLIFVDPGLICGEGKVIIGRNCGYVPDTSLETYFKISDVENFEDRHLSKNSYYVHEIMRHPHLSPRLLGKVIKDFRLISDASFERINEEETSKEPLIDFRLRGRYDLEQRYYFSGMPKDENGAYIDRPDITYREDRPWRMNGFVQHLEQIKTWKFRFLQNEWNTYNLLHWVGSQSKYNYAKIEASRLVGGSYTSWFDVKTKSSIWFEEYGWLIPYNRVDTNSELYDEEMFKRSKFPAEWINEEMVPVEWFGSSISQSDYIDTLNQDGFVFGSTHRFRISSVNIIDGSVITPTISTPFLLDINAASPPVIVSISIDKWTKIMVIRFRFDDIQGRLYDLSDFHYSIDSGATWVNKGFDYLEGNLNSLESNTFGDQIVSQQNLKIHEIRLDLKLMMEVFDQPSVNDDEAYESKILVRLSAVLSDNKSGLLYPVFNFKMWLNELLKNSEDRIIRIGGQKTRWKFVEERDEDDNITTGWEYLPKGNEIIMPGELTIVNNKIEKIEDDFLSWYASIRKHYYPSSDARIDYIVSNSYETSYKLFCFQAYLVHESLESDYLSYVELYLSSDTIKMNMYLQDKYLIRSFEDYCFRRNATLSILFFNDLSLWGGFESWYDLHKTTIADDAYSTFLSYYNLTDEYDQYLIDNGIIGDDFVGYLKFKKYDDRFSTYYSLLNQYANEKSVERIAYVNGQSVLYSSWLSSPLDIDGNVPTFDYLPISFSAGDYDDDKCILFLEWAYENDELPTDDFLSGFNDKNYRTARQYYLSQEKNGITLAQEYSSLVSENLSLLRELNNSYAEKNYFEIQHRIRLIKQGFFSNGFVNNQPYSGTETNSAFRFRVENKPIKGNLAELNSGSTEPIYIVGEDTTDASLGFDNRFNVYFHFQLDFYNTFDSQSGNPLRDKIYQLASVYGYADDEESINIGGVDYVRIPGAIVAESGIKSTPNHVYNTRNEDNGYDIVTTADPYDLRFSGTYSLLKTELPGKLPSDDLPSIYDNYEQLYYWRIAPYNLVERDVMESSFGECGETTFVSNGYYYDSYEVAYLNKFNEKFSESMIGFNDGINLMFNVVRYAVSEKTTHLWSLDKDANSYSYYTWGCHFNPGEMWYRNSWLNTNLIGRGEVHFITDRPRKVEEDDNGTIVNGVTKYSVSYIEDENENFRATWIPYNVSREKPCVIRDGENCEYYMFYHKPNSKKIINGSAVDSCVIVFSIGYNSMSFGEVQRCFPLMGQDDISEIIPNAVSFENPWVIKDDGVYVIYFNVVFWDSGTSSYIKKVYTCNSSDLSTWSIPVCLENLNNCSDVMIYVEEGIYKLYCIMSKDFVIGGSTVAYDCVFGSVSNTYNGFGVPEFIYGGDYQLSSPCFCGEKLYYSDHVNGKIVSIGRISNNEGVGNDTFDCDYPTAGANDPVIEMSSLDYMYCNPCVIEDYDLGNLTKRMYFNLNDHPYLWKNKNLVKFGLDGVTSFYKEQTIGTRYLEMYNWESARVTDVKIDGSSVPFDQFTYEFDGDNYTSSLYPLPCSREGVEMILTFDVYSGTTPLAVRVPMNLFDETVNCESRSEWIDKNNVSLTEAEITPEEIAEDLGTDGYTPLDYLSNNELFDAYNTWRAGLVGDEFDTEEEFMVGFLVYSRHYGDYLKWSCKGPGIYRHLSALDKLSWSGDGQ